MFAWCGMARAENADGLYDPVLDEWRPISTAGMPTDGFGRVAVHNTAVWTGREVIVWGGNSEGVPLDGARYHPIDDEWTLVSTLDAPSPRSGHDAVWTGTEMLVWGGASMKGQLFDGGRYDPFSDEWSAVPPSPEAEAQTGRGVWTGTEAIFWLAEPEAGTVQPARFDPETDEWTLGEPATTTAPWQSWADAWTGELVLVWAGSNLLLYDPTADRWSEAASVGSPSPRTFPAVVWTGEELVVWGGFDINESVHTNDGARYQP